MQLNSGGFFFKEHRPLVEKQREFTKEQVKNAVRRVALKNEKA